MGVYKEIRIGVRKQAAIEEFIHTSSTTQNNMSDGYGNTMGMGQGPILQT